MQHAHALTEADRRRGQAQLLMRLFDRWSLNQAQAANLLDVSATSRATLKSYETGGRGIGGGRDIQQRAGYLLGIHKALRLLYPHNEEMRNGWIKMRNQYFGNRTPLEVMEEQGLIGIARVYECLNFLRGH
jgi:hypothetical protein